ncbi:MAG: adenylate/guanylate cyclase domain-containing protein [Candidatus Ozemobacteraceae bacterium]
MAFSSISFAVLILVLLATYLAWGHLILLACIWGFPLLFIILLYFVDIPDFINLSEIYHRFNTWRSSKQAKASSPQPGKASEGEAETGIGKGVGTSSGTGKLPSRPSSGVLIPASSASEGDNRDHRNSSIRVSGGGTLTSSGTRTSTTPALASSSPFSSPPAFTPPPPQSSGTAFAPDIIPITGALSTGYGRPPTTLPGEFAAGSPGAAEVAASIAVSLEDTLDLVTKFGGRIPDGKAGDEQLLAHVCEFLGFSEVQVYLLDKMHNEFVKLVAAFPVQSGIKKREGFSWKNTPLENVLTKGKPYYFDHKNRQAMYDSPPIPTMACLPIHDGTEIMGLLSVEIVSKTSIFGRFDSARSLLALRLFGAALARRRERARHYEEIDGMKSEISRLQEYQGKLEHTTDFLDKEADRRFFENEKLLTNFKKFLSPIVIEQINANPELLKICGAKQRVAIFFSDIRGFTALSENLDPNTIVTLLNEYFSVMTATVHQYSGTLDKYVGDEIMALFGAPLPIVEASSRAVLCAVEMQEKLCRLQASWVERGLPKFEVGIGINTGEVTVGFLGSEEVLSYTAIGDSVNLAARLCSHAKPRQIIVSEATAAELGKHICLNRLPAFSPKGKAQPVGIYEVQIEATLAAKTTGARIFRAPVVP